jgi:hypothetical protein
MEIQSAHDALEVLVAFAAEEFYAEPLRARMSIGGRNISAGAVGENVEWSGHVA